MSQLSQMDFGFDAMAEEERTAHLPSAAEAGITYYRELLAKHHAAMLSGNVESVMAVRAEAYDLAEKMHGGVAIFGGPDAAGAVLERETAAAPGTVPLWGQTGEFAIAVGSMEIRIEPEGMMGICEHDYWLGFGAHAVDETKPFLSETGYRSFLGIHRPPAAGVTWDRLAEDVCAAYIEETRPKPKTQKARKR